MELIKKNTEKHRAVYIGEGHYHKVWHGAPEGWTSKHAQLLEKFMPGYVIQYGPNWIDFEILEGTPASEMDHTDEFIKRVYKFCLDSIEYTAPYVHGDWTLSNIIVNGDKMQLCDWDNIGIYDKEEVMKKLDSDLESAFGERYRKVIYDTAVV